ncbi:MAG: signal peptidase I [Gammaproteobacteria bacterium]
MNFELILVLLVVVSGAIMLTDKLFFAAKRKQDQQHSSLVEYARSFFPIFLIVLLLRSFLVEPFRIPSGSLEPTLLVGDFVFVNKFQYGLRLPVINRTIIPISEPERGDITVFRWPPNPSLNYIKRIIGLPGDHILYIDKQWIINGEAVPQEVTGYIINSDPEGRRWKVEKRLETLNGKEYTIYVRPDIEAKDLEVTVPPGHYFAIGDNRDDSSDSRYWGFVPEENLVGEGFLVWMSWDSMAKKVRWERIGNRIR